MDVADLLRSRETVRRYLPGCDWPAGFEFNGEIPGVEHVVVRWKVAEDADGNLFIVESAVVFACLARKSGPASWQVQWLNENDNGRRIVAQDQRLNKAGDELREQLAARYMINPPIVELDLDVELEIEGRQVREWYAELDLEAVRAEDLRNVAWRARRTMFWRLRDEGYTQREIAAILGVSKRIVQRMLEQDTEADDADR